VLTGLSSGWWCSSPEKVLKIIPTQPIVAAMVMFLHLNVSSAHTASNHITFITGVKAEACELMLRKQHLVSIMDSNFDHFDQSGARILDADTFHSQQLKITNAV